VGCMDVGIGGRDADAGQGHRRVFHE